MTETATERVAIYRLFDCDDALLYIGVAVDPRERWHGHSVEKSWWPQVTRKEVTWHDTRVSAEQAEAKAIKSERPRFNVEHSSTRQRGDGQADLRGITTKVRYTRISDDDWRDLLAAARTTSSDRGTVIKELVAWYLRRPGAPQPVRPDPASWQQQGTTRATEEGNQ